MPRLLPLTLSALLLAAAAPADNGAVFDRAWSLAGRRYWDPTMKGNDWAAVRERFRPGALAASDDRALYRAINAMLDTLGDSHVYAVAPAEKRMLDDSLDGGAAAGFGLDVVPGEGGSGWVVDGVTPNGPAAKAGVEIGWRLVAIDGQAPDGTRDFGQGDHAVLRFTDDGGGLREVALAGVRLPPEPSRRSRVLAGGVLLLAFDGFDPGLARWMAGEIATAAPRGVVLDVRENDGGDSGTLDRVAGLFFAEKRTVLRLIRRRETEEKTIGAGRDLYSGPMAVLIGPRSASAAEALAALVVESGRGTTVGERSAGALTGASEFGLPDGGLLSVAEWDVRTSTGRRLEHVGLAPDHPVAPTLAERRRGDDPAAECARRLVLGQACGR